MKQFLILFLLLCSTSVFAQDVIVKKDGSTIVCRVVELTSSEIVYKKWSDLNGSNYVMNRADASAINYQNGKRLNLSEATNLYSPNNQNDGVQQYNDKVLIKIDAEGNIKGNPSKKAKTWRTTGWIGGAVLSGVAILSFINADNGGDADKLYYVGGVSAACALIGTPICLLKAHHYKKQAELLDSSIIFQKGIIFNNGSLLSASIDMISDRILRERVLGLGLRYNF